MNNFKKYTLAIISSFGTVDKWIESDSMEELKQVAFERLIDLMQKVESGEEICFDIMHTSDLLNRACYVPIIWHIDACREESPKNLFKI